MNTRLVWITPQAENLIAYMARVSSNKQDNPEYKKLFKYLLDHKHFSPFEMANATFEIVTSRAISAQILRHRSFSFQELSQRYKDVHEFEEVSPRRQAAKNRQSSTDDLSFADRKWFSDRTEELQSHAKDVYEEALARGIAKEIARFLLPMSTQTKLFMNGTIRSWIHYFALRCQEDTQQEHRELALSMRAILAQELPTIAQELNWNDNSKG